MTARIRHLALALAVTGTLAGCATTSALRDGRAAEQLGDHDRAVAEYTRALESDPDSREARQALSRARLRAAQDHFTSARRLYASGRLDEAMVELQLATELNPGNSEVEALLADVRSQLRSQVVVSLDGKTELEALIERARNLPPAGLDLPADVRLPDSLTFRDAGSRQVFSALGRFADLSVVFDPQFRDQPVTIDLRNVELSSALASLTGATGTFYRVTAQRTITIVPDTQAKRTEYEQEVVQTFYLSNADLRETIDLLRIVVDARRIAPIAATNALSIKDTPERVSAAGRLISAIDKARPEVVIDVELLEVDRTRFREFGLQFASVGSPGIDGSATVDGQLTLRDLRNLTQSDIFFTNLPGLFYRLLKTDSSTRTLANPQLRTSDGVAAEARFGERVPVPVTTFAPIATGGVAQQPITSFNYQDIGVNIAITPRTHHDDEVSLALVIEISSISGTGFGGLPTFGNRSINTEIRLRDGETNLLAGLIRDDERQVIEGVPGLSELPLVGRLFANTRQETQETDVVLMLTPRIVRMLDLSEEDLRPFRVGGDDQALGTGLLEPLAPLVDDQIEVEPQAPVNQQGPILPPVPATPPPP